MRRLRRSRWDFVVLSDQWPVSGLRRGCTTPVGRAVEAQVPLCLGGAEGVRLRCSIPRCGGHMEIRVLGPVEVSAGGRPVAIGAGKPRALLVMLAVHEGSTVSTDRLVEGLWGGDPPRAGGEVV